jgi:hypothetical protein
MAHPTKPEIRKVPFAAEPDLRTTLCLLNPVTLQHIFVGLLALFTQPLLIHAVSLSDI